MNRQEDLTKVFDKRWKANHNDDVKKAIQENKDARVIKEIAIKNGMITFDDSYSRLLRKKLTTLEECIMNKEIIN